MNLSIKVSDLRDVVEANRSTHEDTYKKAKKRYKELKKRLDNWKEKIDADFPKEIGISLFYTMPVPENHLEDYDRILEMLSFETRDTIELSESEVRKYIQDNWEWSSSFIANSASYAVTVKD